MPRRVEDIIPNDRRSIRSLSVDKREETSRKKIHHSGKKETEKTEEKEEEIEKTKTSKASSKGQIVPIKIVPATRHQIPKRKTGRSWKLPVLIMGTIVLIGTAGFFASAYFSKATFTIVPKVIPVAVNSSYIATFQNGTTKDIKTLNYELITIQDIASTTIPATSGAPISTKALGKVTIYNAYSTQSQKLLVSTRIANDNGLIYRLTSSVVVPGYTLNGKTVIPGSVSASIVADEPGQQYNISKNDPISDFKMVAYKGTSKYSSIYARMTTDIAGGFVGTKKIVSPSALASSTESLKASLSDSLLEKVHAKIPAGYIMYDKGQITSFASPVTAGNDPTKALVSIKGTINAVIFKEKDLISQIAGLSAISTFGSFAYSAPGLGDLSFTISNPKDFSPEKKNTLIIRLKGDMKIIGTIPTDEIKQKMLGVALADTQDILKPYSAVIESGSGELIPPWSKVPRDPARISFEIKDN